MKKDNFKKQVKAILDNYSYTPTLYALLKEKDIYQIKRISISKTLEKKLEDVTTNWLKEEIDNDNFELANIEYIDENKKIFYGLGSYSRNGSIKFPKLQETNDLYFSENDHKNLTGILVRINKDKKDFWLYQHKYKMTQMNRVHILYAFFNKKDAYEPVDFDIFRIDHKFDFIILEDFIATKNWTLLQNYFGLDAYIKKEAKKNIERIKQLDLISDLSTVKKYSTDLIFARKLMKLKDSVVLEMNKAILMPRIETHPIYSKQFKKDSSTGKIIINTKTSVSNLIKMLNDEILRSELTDQNYETTSKSKFDENNIQSL
ncbi:Kiwa anti-phage protein KwaB-like domain-containing protein [Fibrobacter sp. UWB3]|uniref:Kiwa anti-phage protein KwaB-like domain-containing protein n=1 Tax=Fibrobacter sp. UWB3 TaxID=1964357 RepID=UPI000B5203E0|nr:Kiwa anti-phage protein KwaB-like domain-containing protein [Fibrobacter sp. UWB3]OWV19271.1 hypothetical protein B7991_08440 [Fibrobacter sp. UWB3]